MSKKHPNSRWIKDGPRRQSLIDKIDDGRWVRLHPGTRLGWKSAPISGSLFRFEEDRVSERAWVERRKEADGWFRGARVRRVA